MLTLTEAAARLGVAASTLRHQIRRGKLHGRLVGKTWTTDAPYRETLAKVQRRKSEGCVVVEMESAAFFALAQFRGVTFAQILYGGDDVSGDHEWDNRAWQSQTPVREKLFWLAAEACLSL